jgi:hypothetical protein
MTTFPRALVLLPRLLLVACARPAAPPERVDHEERALAKANAAWSSIYSKTAESTYSAANVRRFAPYSATLENGVWIVRTAASPDLHGRAPRAEVRADDGVTTAHADER